MVSAEPFRVDVINDEGAFAALQPEWNELLQTSAADCPFLTWEWLHAWWTHLRGSSGLRLLTARAGNSLVAIAPMLVSRGHLGLFSRLQFLGTGNAGSDYLDVILRCGCEEAGLRAIAESLERQGMALQLRPLPPASAASNLRTYLGPTGWTSNTSRIAVCPFIRLEGHTWDSYLATVGPAHRANVRRRLKTLAGRFRMRFETVKSEPERQEALAALTTFHDQRWKSRGGSSALHSPALRAFHDDVTRRALESGWLRLYVLRLDDVPAAVMYAFSYNRRFYFYQHGFDERYRSDSVGLVLMGRTIRAAIEDEHAIEFDMLYGNETYKALWAHDQRPLHQLDVFPAHITGTLHQTFVETERTMRALVRRFRSSREAHAT
jgi:CelD/BcsL family acetyltransferase involved in cellulose biosynthesis